MTDKAFRADLEFLALRTLGAVGPILDEDRAVLRAILTKSRAHKLNNVLGESGDDRCWFLLEGWACRARILPNGRRQIFDFILPGDLFGLRHHDQAAGLFCVFALTAGVTVDASAISAHVRSGALSRFSHFCDETARNELASLFNQIARLGSRTAYEATIELLQDFSRRSELSGAGESGQFPMPISQTILSDALGVTPIQMNRIMARLRRDGLISFGQGWVRLNNPLRGGK